MWLVNIELIDPKTGNKINRKLDARVVLDTEKNRSLSAEATAAEFESAIIEMIAKAVNMKG